MLPGNSLRTRLLLFMALGALLSLVILGSLGYLAVRQTLDRSLEQRTVLARTTAAHLGSVLEQIPPYLSPEPVRTYASVDDARRSTGIPLYLPSYFPDYLRWPPEDVRGWAEPRQKMSFTVVLQASGEPALWVEEWLPQPGEPPPHGPEGARPTGRETVGLGDEVEAELATYVGPAGRVYQLLWDQADVRVLLTATLSAEELVRMARSMHPPPSY